MVHVHDPRVRWSVRAAQVMRIAAAAAEWHAPTVDLLAMLGAPASRRDATQRALIVSAANGRDIALLAIGPIDVADVDPSDVLALPEALAASAPHISALVVARDGSLSLLLEPSTVTFAEDTVIGEELCQSRS
jgi:chemotaxis signal transduction protein